MNLALIVIPLFCDNDPTDMDYLACNYPFFIFLYVVCLIMKGTHFRFKLKKYYTKYIKSLSKAVLSSYLPVSDHDKVVS